jgi:hypothetical protein
MRSRSFVLRRDVAQPSVLALLALVAGNMIACGGASAGVSDSAGAAVAEGPALAVDDVTAAIAKLDAQRSDPQIAPYYADGNRIEGCWRNPAGSKLTDLKKAFYCAMPLELRLCNTVVLLSTDDADVGPRYDAYLACQAKVDAVFGGKGLFVYDDDVNAAYKKLFLEGGRLAASDTAAVVDASKPTYSDRSFARILLAIADGLAGEVADLGLEDLRAMEDDFHAAGGEAR